TDYAITRTGGAGDPTTLHAGTSTTYDDATVVPGTQYSYSVVAADAATNVSSPSNTATFTPADNTAPTAPSNLVASQNVDSTVHLSWAGSTDNVGVTEYAITRTGGAGDPTTFNAGTSTTYDDTTAALGTAYSYSVTAIDATNNSSTASNTASITPGDASPPTTPTNLTATPGTGDAVHLAWDGSIDNVGVTDYVVSRTGGGPALTFHTGTLTTYDDTSAAANTPYSYAVVAKDAAGNSSGSATASWTPTDGIAPTAPANVVAAAGLNSSTHVSWTASSDNYG